MCRLRTGAPVPIPLVASISGRLRARAHASRARSGQAGAVENPVLRHAREHLRRHARRLNRHACAFLISPYANYLRRHCCARLRISNTGGATDLLSATVRRERWPGFHTSSTKIPAPCPGRPIGREAPLTVTFTTVTTGRSGSFHPRLNREACRWVSRPYRPSSPHQCLPVRFVQPIVIDDSFNGLKPPPISGEMTTPTGTGACDMRSTGTGTDAVFAHAAPHSGPCAVLPPDDNVSHRSDHGHFTIVAKTSPAPTASVGLERSAYPPLSHPPSRANSQDLLGQRRSRTRRRRPRAAYGFPPAKPHRLPRLLGARHADESEPATMLTADRTNCCSKSEY